MVVNAALEAGVGVRVRVKRRTKERRFSIVRMLEGSDDVVVMMECGEGCAS